MKPERNAPGQDQHVRRRAWRKGIKAEWFAGWMLRLTGHRIVATRYKTRFGEVDLIARKGDLILMVEVKARNSVEQAVDAVTWTAQQRIRTASDVWLSKQRDHDRLSIRYDIIAVVPWRMPIHLKDAF